MTYLVEIWDFAAAHIVQYCRTIFQQRINAILTERSSAKVPMFSSSSTFTGSGEAKSGSGMHRHVRVIEATTRLGDLELKDDPRLKPPACRGRVCQRSIFVPALLPAAPALTVASIHLWSSAQCRAAGASLQTGLRTP